MSGLNEEKLSSVETLSSVLEKAVDSITSKYADDLDEYMALIDSELRKGKRLSDGQLDDMTLNLSSILYFASAGCEDLAIQDDMSKAMYKEAYNSARALIEVGTVADKNSQAELDTAEERIVNVVYSKAYKKLKAKVEAAQEMRGTLKKIMARRIAESEIARTSVDGGREWQEKRES